MLLENFFIQVSRNKLSYDFKFDSKKNSFQNNIKNNMIDTIYLFKDGAIIYSCNKVQTISNHPNKKFKLKDSVRPGTFILKCFVKNNGDELCKDIHAITQTYDLEGQYIDENGYQKDNGQLSGRWLMHDNTYKGIDSINAYSGACFILGVSDHNNFNLSLRSNDVGEGDTIKGELFEYS